MNAAGLQFERLLELMKALRAPDGCPWDREQTSESLLPGFIEELYEFVDAVEENDPKMVKEELGDLCLHIAFQATLAVEKNEFTMADALEDINQKLIRRHPHVFAGLEVADSAEVLVNWDAIKKTEKADSRKSAIDGVPNHLPALSKAHKVQNKARKVGFDWDKIDTVIDKVDEEILELKEAYTTLSAQEVEDEFGDVLFSLVNLARFLDIDPEKALNQATKKFSKRFRKVEDKLAEQGKSMPESNLAEMDDIWNQIKHQK